MSAKTLIVITSWVFILTAIWLGAFLLHIYQNTWMEVPIYITICLMACVGMFGIGGIVAEKSEELQKRRNDRYR